MHKKKKEELVEKKNNNIGSNELIACCQQCNQPCKQLAKYVDQILRCPHRQLEEENV